MAEGPRRRLQLLVTLMIGLVLVIVAQLVQVQIVDHRFYKEWGEEQRVRSIVMAGWYSGPAYGRILGTQWTVAAVTGSLMPAAAGWLRDVTGSYCWPLAATALIFCGAAAAAGRQRPPLRLGSCRRLAGRSGSQDRAAWMYRQCAGPDWVNGSASQPRCLGTTCQPLHR